MNALKNSRRTLVVTITLLVCLSGIQGSAQVSEEDVKRYRLLAEQGDAKAQRNLGLCYANGDGVPQDYEEAVKWFRKAAEQGEWKAQFSLGVCYSNGRGVPKDDAEAVKWYRLAAEQGVVAAQYNLGLLYYNGEGVPQDYAEAVKWYRLAAEQGNAGAQNNLGMCYRTGEGVPQDHAEALKWVRLAAEQGDADAQFLLGVCYANGEGVTLDYVLAYMWSNLAASSGDEDAKTYKAELLERMTRAQIAEVEALSGAVDGYEDLKFGMTSEEAQATDVVKNGKVLFGEKRNVGFGTDKSGKVAKILIQLGDFDEEIRDQIIPILSKKYQLMSEPDDKDFDAYNQDGLTAEEEFKVGLSYDAVGTILGIQIDDLALRNVSWDFAGAQVSFVIGKMIDDRKSTKYLTVYKDIMYVAYRNQITANALVSEIRAKQQKRNTKTTSDDF